MDDASKPIAPDEGALHQRAAGLRKLGAGLPLSEAERAALEATKGQPLSALPEVIYHPDVTMGFVFYEVGHLVRQIDGIAKQFAERLAPDAQSWTKELLAWATLRRYAERAEENARDEAEYFDEALSPTTEAHP